MHTWISDLDLLQKVGKIIKYDQKYENTIENTKNRTTTIKKTATPRVSTYLLICVMSKNSSSKNRENRVVIVVVVVVVAPRGPPGDPQGTPRELDAFRRG